MWLFKNIHEAAKIGDVRAIKRCLRFCSNVNARDNTGWTPLMLAISNGFGGIVEYLVANGADVNVGSKYLWAPLILAAYNRPLEIVEFPVVFGTDIYDRMIASVQKVADWTREKQDPRIEGDWTPLMLASNIGRLDIINHLVAKGADVNAKCNYNWTPLMFAAHKGHVEVVEYLVENGAAVDDKGCVKYRFDKCLQYYWNVQVCGDNNTSEYDWAPLTMAANNGHLDVVKHLVAKGAQFGPREHYARTPLTCAARNGHLDIVQFLVGNGADVNRRDKDTEREMSYARRSKRVNGMW